ncbi:DUF4431 domain-containing protein [Caulobacter sp. FWC2]|uniref:DUF4431 domain-containing protein n=1 Tax=Caulobacter sp. FWC2 TaxID=69664 RepID=UPI000C153457|nr:DUF4431 domain-containing protein [Caulobacter sp. FWC2]PIB93215.1 hypothetical protein CSW62_17470 [Caulobacter sp. FWC2]
MPLLVAALTVAACLSHTGRQSLDGVLVAHTFAGPPNFESIKDGDRPERYWLLRLPKPICVADDPSDPDMGAGAQGVREIQLILKAEDFDRYRPLLGKPVTAEGDFMSAISGHHHTPILLQGATLKKR